MDSANFEEAVGKLDVLLAYLWKVHGVDYYSGVRRGCEEWCRERCSTFTAPAPTMVVVVRAAHLSAASAPVLPG